MWYQNSRLKKDKSRCISFSTTSGWNLSVGIFCSSIRLFTSSSVMTLAEELKSVLFLCCWEVFIWVLLMEDFLKVSSWISASVYAPVDSTLVLSRSLITVMFLLFMENLLVLCSSTSKDSDSLAFLAPGAQNISNLRKENRLTVIIMFIRVEPLTFKYFLFTDSEKLYICIFFSFLIQYHFFLTCQGRRGTWVDKG